MKKLRNFRTSYGTDVKLQSLSKLEKRDTSTSKKIKDDVIVVF